MGKGRAAKRVAAVAAVVGAMGAIGAAPAQAAEWVPCDSPSIGPICDTAERQVNNVLTEVEAQTDYVLYWGDKAIDAVNDAYYTVSCGVLGECS